MPIAGMSLISMEANRTAIPSGEIKVNTAPKITNMKETEIISTDNKALLIEFEFLTEYEPNIGRVKITGEVVYVGDDTGKILAQWKKNKTLPENASVEVLNHLFRTCLLKSSDMANDLQLPLPFQLPRVVPKDKNKEKDKK